MAARGHKGDLMEGETEKYSFAMLKGDPALRIQPQLSMSDVVARLGADAEAGSAPPDGTGATPLSIAINHKSPW